jgi:hypothetical protein
MIQRKTSISSKREESEEEENNMDHSVNVQSTLK